MHASTRAANRAGIHGADSFFVFFLHSSSSLWSSSTKRRGSSRAMPTFRPRSQPEEVPNLAVAPLCGECTPAATRHSLGHVICRVHVRLVCSCCSCVMCVLADAFPGLPAVYPHGPAVAFTSSDIGVQVNCNVFGQLTKLSQRKKYVCFFQYATNMALSQHKG